MEERLRKRKNITSNSPAKSLKREFSAGGVVFRKYQISNISKAWGSALKYQIKWLMTKSSPSELITKSVWRLPKGRLDDEDGGRQSGPLASGVRKATEEEIQRAALKEVKEEGGVDAKIVRKIGTERYFFIWQGDKFLKFVTFYLMQYIRDLPEGHDEETEEVAWLPYEDARKKLSYSSEKKVLDKAARIIFSKD